MMGELKPCPFCGVELELKKGWYPADNSDAYVHPNNGCILSDFHTENGFSKTGECIKLWNERSMDNAQKSFDILVKHFLGDDYYKQFDWLNNITGNYVAIQDIMRAYPKRTTRMIRKIVRLFRKCR